MSTIAAGVAIWVEYVHRHRRVAHLQDVAAPPTSLALTKGSHRAAIVDEHPSAARAPLRRRLRASAMRFRKRRRLDFDKNSHRVYKPALSWALWPWQRCAARRERTSDAYWGRCELRKGHDGDHALERGMDEPRWSTRWTA